jgi:hypothetical protein
MAVQGMRTTPFNGGRCPYRVSALSRRADAFDDRVTPDADEARKNALVDDIRVETPSERIEIAPPPRVEVIEDDLHRRIGH